MVLRSVVISFFFLLHEGVQFSQHRLLKRLPFLHNQVTVLYKFSPIDKTTGGAMEAEPDLENTSWKALVDNSLTAAQLTD